MPTVLEQLQYGFDRDSRRTWRRRSLTSGEDNHYGYDGLSQVVGSSLGNLNLNQTAISAVPSLAESWNYDPTGNWKGYTVEADGAVTLDQHRVHDKGNRLTQIEDSPNHVLLDRVGRMTEMAPDATGNWNESLTLKWDAWSRITEVRRASDDSVLGTYSYDGLTRRTTRTVTGTTHHSYYSDAWRPLEDRKDSQTTASAQYLWGARHRDDLVRRDRATTSGGSLDETRYVLMDYYSPAAITNASGAVTERYAFSAFGVRRILAPDFTPRSTSECGFDFAFQGQFLDAESGLLNYGYRYYSPFLGRWTCKDPIEEQGGVNLYGYVGNDGVNRYDLFGTSDTTQFFEPGPHLPPHYRPSKPGFPANKPETVAVKRWLCEVSYEIETLGKGACPAALDSQAVAETMEAACGNAASSAESKLPPPDPFTGKQCCKLGKELGRKTAQILWPITFPPGIRPA